MAVLLQPVAGLAGQGMATIQVAETWSCGARWRAAC
jgi:hypothetical protein